MRSAGGAVAGAGTTLERAAGGCAERLLPQRRQTGRLLLFVRPRASAFDIEADRKLITAVNPPPPSGWGRASPATENCIAACSPRWAFTGPCAYTLAWRDWLHRDMQLSTTLSAVAVLVFVRAVLSRAAGAAVRGDATPGGSVVDGSGRRRSSMDASTPCRWRSVRCCCRSAIDLPIQLYKLPAARGAGIAGAAARGAGDHQFA